jgi:hypothetical protein
VANLAGAFEGFYAKLAETEATLKAVTQPLYQHQQVYVDFTRFGGQEAKPRSVVHTPLG